MRGDMTIQPVHVFGPVRSRRLGLSLGIDLMPRKKCNFDCIYCQVGPTDQLTTDMEYSPKPDIVLEQVRQAVKISEPDYLTLSGSGEPTLYGHLKELLKGLKGLGRAVAVITNSSGLYMPSVRDALQEADLVMPSLDAGDEETFQKINRPHPELTFEKCYRGLKLFCEEYKGLKWLEVLLVDGINTSDKSLNAIISHAEALSVDRIQLNTVTRPCADGNIRPVKAEFLQKAARSFGLSAEVMSAAPENPRPTGSV